MDMVLDRCAEQINLDFQTVTGQIEKSILVFKLETLLKRLLPMVRKLANTWDVFYVAQQVVLMSPQRQEECQASTIDIVQCSIKRTVIRMPFKIFRRQLKLPESFFLPARA